MTASGQKQPVDLAHISGELLLKADIQRCINRPAEERSDLLVRANNMSGVECIVM